MELDDSDSGPEEFTTAQAGLEATERRRQEVRQKRRLAQQQVELRRKKSGYKGTAGGEPLVGESAAISSGGGGIAGSEIGDGLANRELNVGSNVIGAVQTEGEEAGEERRRKGRRRMGEEQRKARPSRRTKMKSTEGEEGEQGGDEEDAEKLLPADVVARLVERHKEEKSQLLVPSLPSGGVRATRGMGGSSAWQAVNRDMKSVAVVQTRRDGAIVVRTASVADAAALAAAGLPSTMAGGAVHVRFSALTRKGVSQAAEARSFRNGLLFGPGVARSKQMVGLLDSPVVKKGPNKSVKGGKRT